jgi:cyclopropane-fatty-acyl-phospholipid synthase
MLLDAILSGLIRRGTLAVRYPDGTVRRYQGAPGPAAAMEIRTPRAVRRLALDPGLAFGEGYMDGEIAPVGGSIYDLLEVLVLNLCEAGGTHPAERVMEWWRRARRRLDQFNPAPRARRNAAHHYDLDRRLFSLFLDRDLQYSCAYFPTGRESLDEAQELKKRHIAAKLRLDRPGLEVLEIGCGWGTLADIAADEQVAALGIFRRLPAGRWAEHTLVDTPITIDGEVEHPPPGDAPLLGEHNAAILAELGYAADEVG